MALSAWLRGSSPGPRRCVIPVALTDWKDPDSFYAAFVTGATLRGASSAKVDPRAADGETECTARSLPIIAAAHVRRDDAVAAADAAAASGGAADGAAECAASCSRLSPSEVESIAAVAAHCEIPAGDVELRGELGHGSFGVVRAASWRHTPVAVKVLFDHVSPHDRALFRNEVSIMASIQHPNIVQFLGYARLPELALVMEIFPRGSIQDYMIFDKPPSRIRLRFCVDMARGLEYLHQRQPGIIIHRDIKPQNYFLTEALTCKLGDFGISSSIRPPAPAPEPRPPEPRPPCAVSPRVKGRTLRQQSAPSLSPLQFRPPERQLRPLEKPLESSPGPANDELTANCGTVRYMAPEVASPAPRAAYTVQADIFSLAMVFYFVWERATPTMAGLVEPATYLNGLRSGRRPVFSKTPKAMRALITDMWSTDASARPRASEILERLERLKCTFGTVSVDTGKRP